MHEIEVGLFIKEVGLVGVISELTIHKFTTKHTSPPTEMGPIRNLPLHKIDKERRLFEKDAC